MIALLISAVALLLWAGVIWYGFDRRVFRKRRPGQIRPAPSRRVVITVVLGLLAAPVVAVASSWGYLTCLGGGFDLGISRSDGECVGITDGGYEFSGALSDDFGDDTRGALDRVEAKIAEQNAAIEKPAVTVAFVATFTSDLSGPRLVHQLEGAAAAQQRINRDRPYAVRLVLAHLGTAEKQWKTVLDQVVELRDDQEQPLVAAIGLGLSTSELAEITRTLSEKEIPMVSDVVTATNVGTTRDFRRIAYSNRDQVQALLAKPIPPSESVLLMRYADDTDTYTKSGAEATAQLLNDNDIQHKKLDFGTAIALDPLCPTANGSATVFYAGRSRYLSRLFDELVKDNTCGHITVLSTSDAAILKLAGSDKTAIDSWGIQRVNNLLEPGGRFSIRYTPLSQENSRPQFQDLKAAMNDLDFNPADLSTGWAANAWDALKVVDSWINKVLAEGRKLDATEVLARSRVMHTGQGAQMFDGATGSFCFAENGDRVDSTAPTCDLSARKPLTVVAVP
ncbi:ABC-type branched-subunit amino acid transport system substrate-binding protein [Actinokineospora baliensis]|uniref:ABC transporter substrate-binding protein n=1 Tax=Actinokineospora baliensis TaxID=547056 RepID=UPI00195C40E1|nr:ABC transporter substrate-binding protein [Actinokineospora baliensis]MBM7776143.1 ABC-type branched-subunit amino acid transport system substrate-binding protein [Actinokineospora baliensis]